MWDTKSRRGSVVVDAMRLTGCAVTALISIDRNLLRGDGDEAKSPGAKLEKSSVSERAAKPTIADLVQRRLLALDFA